MLSNYCCCVSVYCRVFPLLSPLAHHIFVLFWGPFLVYILCSVLVFVCAVLNTCLLEFHLYFHDVCLLFVCLRLSLGFPASSPLTRPIFVLFCRPVIGVHFAFDIGACVLRSECFSVCILALFVLYTQPHPSVHHPCHAYYMYIHVSFWNIHPLTFKYIYEYI